ncbi:MAG TPA: hypothetical protein VHK69_06440 [Chitinophagaceae bacterium]|jgi:hypothetical protein|nr:hypothetical protein [Chitinophagaceae bacterium]
MLPFRRPLLLALFLCTASLLQAQQVTGVWKGKLDKRRVEVKLVQKGDSLTGTSYYYETAGSYRRYSVKGYFDPETNAVVWWDDQLLEEKGLRLTGPGKTALLSTADFNCPGGGEMYLDGEAAPKEGPEDKRGPAHLTKTGRSSFPDEWDYVIDNWTSGTSDPEIIDSVALVAFRPQEPRSQPAPEPRRERPRPGMVAIPSLPEPERRPEPAVTVTPSLEQKFTVRRKEFKLRIPVAGDSLEFRFYDNAQVDGDSISLFLNGRMVFTHIRLTAQAYTIKIPAADLRTGDNELVMVAENLGSIPPNTSYMVALSGKQRYEARLSSTEETSAMIVLRKE